METERVIIALIVALIGIVAGFNILTTIFVSVTQKQRDISVLKALGARNRQIVGLFVKQGVVVGTIGGILGMGLALAIARALQKYQFVELPDPYFLAELPVNYDWRVYLGVAGAGILTCILAGLVPALIGARVSPSEGFRGTGRLS